MYTIQTSHRACARVISDLTTIIVIVSELRVEAHLWTTIGRLSGIDGFSHTASLLTRLAAHVVALNGLGR